MNEIETLKREMEELKDWKKSLEASHSIPLNVDQSFRERFKNIAAGTTLSPSAVNPNTKEQIHETVSFPQTFSGFKTTSEGILIPYYNP